MNPLDIPVRLVDLFEPGLLEDLCRGFAEQHGVGLRVYDQQVGALAEVKRDGGMSTWLFEHPEARRAFVALVDELKTIRLEPQEAVVKEDSTTASRYLVVPLTWDQEVLGKVVCGPYLLPGAVPASPELARALADVPRYADEALRSRVQFLLQAIDLVCHAGYRAFVTGSVHLASISRAHEDLQRAHRELAATNARLTEQNERLREVDTLKSEFLSTVSHELRTPLTSIIGYSEMMLEGLAGPLTDEQREYLRTILERGLNLLNLIQEVLAFSRAEHIGRQEVRVGPVAVAKVVQEAISAVRPQAQKGNLVLEVEVPPNLPTLSTDAVGLRQALINLLGNAVKFTDPGGVVRLHVVASARGGQPMLRFSVTDTGIGIPADALPRIFEPFYQVDGSSTRSYGGTGLGLSIVRRFAESQGGHVDVESARGVGSTFTLDLPLVAARAAPEPERAPERAAPPDRSPRPHSRSGRGAIPAWAEREVKADRDPTGRGGGHRS